MAIVQDGVLLPRTFFNLSMHNRNIERRDAVPTSTADASLLFVEPVDTVELARKRVLGLNCLRRAQLACHRGHICLAETRTVRLIQTVSQISRITKLQQTVCLSPF